MTINIFQIDISDIDYHYIVSINRIVIICVTINIFQIDSSDIDYHYTVSRNRIAIICVTINIFQIDSGIANTSVKRTREITA